MSEVSEDKIPAWFWVVSGLALVWNLLGVMAYVGQVTMGEEGLAKMSEADQAVMANLPAWYTGAFAIAVFGGAIGCLGLLLRKKWALPALVVSFVAVLAQQAYMWLMSDIGASSSGVELGMTLSIPVVAILLIWFARKSISSGR